MKFRGVLGRFSNITLIWICISNRGIEDQGRQGQKETWPSPPILQIRILKPSSPRCVISKEGSVQPKWIDELWFRQKAFYLFNLMGPGAPPRLTPPLPSSMGLSKINYIPFGTKWTHDRGTSVNDFLFVKRCWLYMFGFYVCCQYPPFYFLYQIVYVIAFANKLL